MVIVAATVLAVALRLLQLTRPGHLLGVTEYDDGVYFGAALRLVHGVLPYRDFILVQPPGLIILMIPLAALAKVTGTAWGMGIARLVTACAGAASVPLAGLLVRRRGLLALVITCGLMAVYPEAIHAAKTVLQEPWLVLFCLLGLLAVFDDDRLSASAKRLAWGGAAMGFAGSIKLWAVFPIAVLIIMCARRPRLLAAYAGGVAAGFLVPVLPFAAMDPSSFFRGVFVAQLVRVDAARIPLWIRLADLSGATAAGRGTAFLVSGVIAAGVVLACAAASAVTRRLPPPLESFALVTTALIVAAFLWPVDFYYHYACFLAPFLALAVALPVARLVRGAAERAARGTARPRLEPAAAVLAVIAIVAMTAVQAHAEATAGPARDPTYAPSLIPAGACVATDQVSLLIAADRFTSDKPGCSQMVDGFGTDLDLSRGKNGSNGAAETPAVRAVWASAFRAAQYVWLSSPPRGAAGRRIAWTPSLMAYFRDHFRALARNPRIYRRISS